MEPDLRELVLGLIFLLCLFLKFVCLLIFFLQYPQRNWNGFPWNYALAFHSSALS